MSYITREDGVHFVIPSYRDVLVVKQKSQLKKEILMLSQNYGEYITLQKKVGNQYEVAFSPDTGYLLGESIWHNFKRPIDMIYCEAIPNTTEAILVIVKSSSVYLDGSFPLESIPEELIIFLTQQNNFDIYTYGDVPISKTPEDGKFSFEANSVKSFTVLDKPAFSTVPLLRIYQLQLVDPVLKSHGIGVFPTRQLVTLIVFLGLGWMLWSYMTRVEEKPAVKGASLNPYQLYLSTLNSPAPEDEIHQLIQLLRLIVTVPGWIINSFTYTKGTLDVSLLSVGGNIENVFAWANRNNMTVNIKPDGVSLTTTTTVPKRLPPKQIFPINQVLAVFVDKMGAIYPGNRLTLGNFAKKGVFTSVPISIKLEKVSTILLELIGEQFKDLPFVLRTINATVDRSDNLTGTIDMDALGN
jgi:hypothetical protein